MEEEEAEIYDGVRAQFPLTFGKQSKSQTPLEQIHNTTIRKAPPTSAANAETQSSSSKAWPDSLRPTPKSSSNPTPSLGPPPPRPTGSNSFVAHVSIGPPRPQARGVDDEDDGEVMVGPPRPPPGLAAAAADDDDDDEEEEEEEGVDDEEDGDDDEKYSRGIDDDHEDDDIERHPKKRKLKSLVSSYEFAPRVPLPPVAALAVPKPSVGGRNPLTDWTEHETFVLLDAWGEKFLQRGKKSLRSDEWQEVAEKVSDKSKIERTDTQCRNRLDTLKKKYKIERIKLAEDGGGASKWVYFKKMDVLMSTSAQQGGLSCGMDSGEYVSMNPRVYSNHSNGFDEMRDSPGNSELARDEDDSDGLPPKKRRLGRDCIEQSPFGLLADSIHKFSEIYEKIESSKRQQMLELEKMRMDFQRDLEMQKRQIIERAQAAIAKIHQVGEEEDSISANSA